jgi:hypothetical protein
MKCFMTAQEKCDLLIQVTAEYRWPHGQVRLYFLLLSWVFRLFTSEEIFWQIGDSDTTKKQSKLKQHMTKEIIFLLCHWIIRSSLVQSSFYCATELSDHLLSNHLSIVPLNYQIISCSIFPLCHWIIQRLYFLLLSWVFRLFTSEEIFWQIGDSDTTKSQSKLKQHITKKVVNLWGKPCDRYGSMSYSTWNPSRMPNLVTDVGALCFSDPWNGGWTCDIWMIQWHNGKIEQEMIW